MKQEKFIRRFLARIDKTDSCWNWTGAHSGKNEYGQMQIDGKQVLVHRVAYSMWVGRIPDGLVLDHLCRNRKCVRPEHLEAVTLKENIARGVGITAQNGRKTHCKRGHEFDKENTKVTNEGRYCITCKRLASRTGDNHQEPTSSNL